MGPHMFLLSFLISAVLGANIEIKSKYQVVKEGEPVEILCSTNGAVDYCRIEVPGEGQLSLSENKPPYHGIAYFGQGLMKGECGATIPRAMQKHNGEIRCTFTASSENKESSANMTLIVAKAPTRPSLSVGKSPRGNQMYEEGNMLTAVCTVQNGRPPANISWYLGETRIQEGTEPINTKRAADDLFTVEQKLTRTVQASDNGKELRCQAEHPLLQGKDTSTSQKIQVRFAPKSMGSIEQFGLVEGEDGRVVVVVSANPRPSFIWRVDDRPLHEREDNDRYRVETAQEIPPESGNWESVLIIKGLTKEDVNKVYTLTAENEKGEKSFTVNLSTSPGPQGMEVGAGTIIAIVAAGLIVVTITAMLLFARAKGRWCFAGNQGGRGAGESSDTESAEHHAEHKSKLVFTSVFKKKNDKVSVDEEKPKDVTVNDEKVALNVYDTAEGCEAEEGTPANQTKEESVVYAELDLNNVTPQPRPTPDKTEYAEILHTGKQ